MRPPVRDPALVSVSDRLRRTGGGVLVIQTAFLGDVILLTPLLRATRRAFPKARLAVVTIPECSAPISGAVDEVISFDKRTRRGRRGRWRKLVERIRSGRFDLALLPHRSLRSALTAAKAGIPVRIGFDRGIGARLHTHRVAYPRELYEGRRNLKLLETVATVEDDGLPELRPSAEDEQVVDRLLGELGVKPGEFILVAPGSVWRTKRWLEDYYRELMQRIAAGPGYTVLLSGGTEDAALCGRIACRPQHNLAGRLTVLQSAALAKRAHFVVSGDTAAAHIATSVDARQLIIFGSTAPRLGFVPPTPRARVAEVKLWCRPCTDHGRNLCPRPGRMRCMTDLTPARVFEAVRDWLE